MSTSIFEDVRKGLDVAAPAIRRSVDRSALDNILAEAKGKSPLEQNDMIAQILTRVSPERQPAAIQLLKDKIQLGQQFGARDEALREGGVQVPQKGMPTQSSAALGASRQPQQAQAIQGQPQAQELDISETISPRGDSIKVQDDFLQGSPEALQSAAAQLMVNQPLRFQNPDIALAEAEKRFNKQQSVLTNTENAFNKAVADRLEKAGSGVNQAVTGDLKQDFLRKAQREAAKEGISAEKAADQASRDLLDFAKARSNLNSMTVPSLLGLTPSGKAAQSKLQAVKKDYEKLDRMELFEDDLVNKTGLSTGVASFVAFPPENNPKINRYLQDTKKKTSFNPFQGALVKGIQTKDIKGKTARTPQEIGQFIADNIQPNDSLNSLATAFNARGYDPQIILDVVQQQWDDGKLSLNRRQQRDLQKRTTFRSTLKDIAFFSGTGLKTKDIVNE